MKSEHVRCLSDWLGPEGAVAGLDRSNLTNAELMFLARELGLTVGPKTARREIVVEIVMSSAKRIDRPTEYLLKMSADELKRYFSDRMVSKKELTALLDELGLAPRGILRGKMADFAAREISELGMYQRVAKGTAEKRN